jgi:hypothetical protein
MKCNHKNPSICAQDFIKIKLGILSTQISQIRQNGQYYNNIEQKQNIILENGKLVISNMSSELPKYLFHLNMALISD